jgi:phosphoribosylaminoimidazole-succinocarboxamide synthase
MKLINKGKVKEVYEVGKDELEFRFTDNISVFDKVIPTSVPYKGESLCKTSAYWFALLKEMGIKTHFLGLADKNKMRVKKVEVIRDYSKITTETTNYLIPLEFICRYYVSGSLHDRIEKGEIKPEDLGFEKDQDVQYGTKLPFPFFECTTKLEEFDRKLTIQEALEMGGLTKDEFDNIRRTILQIDDKIESEVGKRGLIHVDGKKELAFDEDRNLMLIDTFGTADEDRFWDAQAYAKGEFVEFSKEFVRQYYRGINYLEKLEKAREEGNEEPDIPGLPNEVVGEVSKLYVDIYQRLTGLESL